MNNLLRIVSKSRFLINPVKKIVSGTPIQQRQLARNLWYMSNSRSNSEQFTQLCTCGCLSKQVHSKAEKDLVEFLTEEILSERKAQKSKTLPTELDGFKVQLNGAEVTLTKQVENETIRIIFNVNHSVDDVEPEIEPNMDKPELGELKSKPSFNVQIISGKTTLSLSCLFSSLEDQEEGYSDIFELDELSIYDGEWNENIYSISGDTLDTHLNDLILNYLEEKGISNEFVEKLSQYSTAYEQSAYIGFLEGLSKFASKK